MCVHVHACFEFSRIKVLSQSLRFQKLLSVIDLQLDPFGSFLTAQEL